MKKKRGPLSRAEEYYVSQNPDGKSVKELANEMNRTVVQIDKAIKKAEANRKKESITTTRPEPYINNLIGKKKRNDQVVATVMTEAASTYCDETRKVGGADKLDGAIFRPKG